MILVYNTYQFYYSFALHVCKNTDFSLLHSSNLLTIVHMEIEIGADMYYTSGKIISRNRENGVFLCLLCCPPVIFRSVSRKEKNDHFKTMHIFTIAGDF